MPTDPEDDPWTSTPSLNDWPPSSSARSCSSSAAAGRPSWRPECPTSGSDARRRVRLRAHRRHHGLRRRPRERRPLQPRGHPRARARPAVRWRDGRAVRRHPGRRGDRGGGGPLRGRQRRRRLRRAGVRLRQQRVRRPLPRRLLAALRPRGRDRADRDLPLRHPRRHRHPRTQGLRADRDRPVADPDPPGQHPGQQHVGEPGPLHRPGPVRRRRRARPAVGVLAGATRRGRDRRA